MNIYQMDNLLQTELFSIASNAFSGFQPEERMQLLNNAQLRVIHSVVNPIRDSKKTGYAGTRFRLDEIETLITRKSVVPYQLDSRSVYYPLPSEYLHGSEIDAQTGCAAVNVTYPEVPFNIVRIPLPTAAITTNWVITINTTEGPIVAFTMTDYLAAGFDARLNYELIALVMRKVTHPALQLYWERYGDIYVPNNFIFIWFGSTPGLTSITTVLNGAAPVITLTDTDVHKVSTVTGSVKLVPCRTIDASIVSQDTNPFTRSVSNNPLVTLESGKVRVIHSGRFAVKTIELTYFRKPLELSLLLNQSCELGTTYGTKEDICRHIVAEAVQLATGMAGNPLYQIVANEAQLTS